VNPEDPLDRLLASWQPRAPAADARVVSGTMRAVRASRAAPAWRRWLALLDEAAQDWLPSPAAALPAMGALVLLVGALHFASAVGRAREASALEWRDSVMRPSSPLWIAAAHRDVAGPPSRP
jgi:hypothetical protein